MFYHIFYTLLDVNLFQYITFRAGGAILTSLIITFLIAPAIIRNLKKYKIGQVVRNDGPKTHQVKSGTTTMGGIIILLSLLISTLLWARLDNNFIMWLIAATIYFGMIGFVDDYLKLVKKNPKGLSAKKKLLFQSLFAILVIAYLYLYPTNAQYATSLNIPYLKTTFIEMSFLYFVLIFLVIVGSSNAVNLTDGLDGLATGNIIIAAVTLAIFSYLIGHSHISSYLKVPYVAGAGEISVFLMALFGAGLGFLWYNSYPAEIFMGDTGSLCLGGLLGLSAVFIKQELILFILGGIFVAEALSVMIQVSVFKRTQKRVFRMAPLHHHFELGGLAETKVTIRFWIIGIVLAIISIASLKLR
ncbi:MAG: phospho-N-acetylmuramoyl-pentapeptide-transferase [Elusimicrobia bacterium]|nr:phospho-N-acetylmuramoyl-pentapeptide-transferase [Elusimicrobiota bacterium]